MIIRNQLITLQERMQEPRQFIQVLAGPRQVGKTTLIKQFVERCNVPVLSVNADAVAENQSEWIAEQWNIVRNRMLLYKYEEHILIIDEIQKLNNWSEVVKREWDADTWNNINIKVVLLGSSRLLLKDGLTESLAGRFEMIRMPHWSFIEMREAFGFDLNKYIYYGGYPGAAKLIGSKNRWKQYMLQSIIDPAIEKDVLMTKRIHKPALLRQVFELGSACSGEIVAYTKLLGQLQDAGNASTLANYLYTLGEANLLCAIPKFAKNIARKYQSIPKLQVYNTGLLSVYQGKGFEAELLSPERWGRWVESAVGAHLMNAAEEEGYQITYWREDNSEVDFVISAYPDTTLAIEVKSGHRQDNAGLHLFREKYKDAKTLVVGTGGFSLEEFLSIPLRTFVETLR